MKIATIVGARPQFIKLAPLSTHIREKAKEILIHTGQHYDYEMSEIFFKGLSIPEPDYNLEVGSDSHGRQTGEMLERIEELLMQEVPDIVLVFGDTNSTLAGALAAVKLNIPIAHVESGLRSFNRIMPEEINRVLTDHCSDLLFAPTETAVMNLQNEGITKGVHNVGDVMFDSLNSIFMGKGARSDVLERLGLIEKDYSLLTLHRAENTNVRENMHQIFHALMSTGERIIFPVHPRTRGYLENYGMMEEIKRGNIQLIPPVSYLEFLTLLSGSRKMLTDSGGIQKEAYMLRIPCITLRTETEWIETVEEGWNVIVGTDEDMILNAMRDFEPSGVQKPVFGDGNASIKIVDILHEFVEAH